MTTDKTERPETVFRTQLLNELLSAGHKAQPGSAHYFQMNGEHIEVRVTEIYSGGTWHSKPTGRLTVTIGDKRFMTRKAGWDWPAIVAACVASADKSAQQRARQLERERVEDAVEADPDMIAARKLARDRHDIRLADYMVGRIQLHLHDITAAQALAVLKLLRDDEYERGQDHALPTET